MKPTIFSLGFFFALSSFAYQPSYKYHIITESRQGKSVEYSVIKEDLNLRNSQNILSQELVYKKISYKNDPNIMKEALDYERQKGLRLLGQPKAGKPLWVAKKMSWSAQDEVDYQNWFSQNVNTNFNEASNLLADCADVGLLFRWAYAHDKKLPVANTLSGSGKLFGHFSSSTTWDKLPTHAEWKKDERFKAAMRYLFNNTYTHSIFSDLYPTQITPQYVHPGSVYMIIRASSGHTQTIHKIDAATAGIKTLWGNEPSSLAIYSSWFMWEPAVKNMFGMWRWPVYTNDTWKLTSAKSMPGYSEEQFIKRKELGEDLFRTWVLDRLGLVDYIEFKATREVQTVRDALEYRLQITAEAALMCGYIPCAANSTDDDSYSSQSRDSRMIQSQKDLLKTISEAGGVQSPTIQKALSSTHIDEVLIEGYGYTYRDFILNKNLLNRVKPEANLSFRERWGLPSFPTAAVEFQSHNQVLRINLQNRVYTVDDQFYYCKYYYDCSSTTDPTVLSFNTSKIDSRFTLLSKDLIKNIGEPDVQGAVLSHIEDSYRSLFASSWDTPPDETVASPLCENPSRCTFYDVIWKNNGLDRVKNWKSTASSSLSSRWGF